MSVPRVLFLINGGPESIEAVRARGLSQGYPKDRVGYLTRGPSRGNTAREWRREIKTFAPDLLYVINTAMPGVLTAWWWRKIHGVPYIVDTGDVVYEMARSAGLYPAWKLPLLKLGENQALRNAHTVVVRGSEHVSYLQTQGLRRVELIRDGYHESPEVAPATLKALRTKLGLEGKFVVGLMGSLVYSPRLQICYGWDLVTALAQLKDLPIQGLIIGDGPGRSLLEERAAREGVADRITFCGRIPYAEVPSYLSLLDIALSTQTNNLPGRVRTTGKLPEYMAAERFILASRVGDATRLLPPEMLLDYEGEVDKAYPARMAACVRDLFMNRERLQLRESLPTRAEQHCSYRVLSERFREVVVSVKQSASPR